MRHKVWSCKFCTLENEVKLEKCKACGTNSLVFAIFFSATSDDKMFLHVMLTEPNPEFLWLRYVV
ncbi:hypothetical protein F2Q69_00014673 [Brassica cretica]|uniref:RanBP2-type domain-containing protein n=1 Tax=Brassica cretica TaxID=69181 RepID=A0A8S9QL42_BRACR|nr:hypothetical protein F2Q69_00014673 [Brassica cretica]